MADIKVVKIVRVDKFVPDIEVDNLIITKNKDQVIVSLDSNIVTEFEDREAFMQKLYDYFLRLEQKGILVNKLNNGVNPIIPTPEPTPEPTP